jgi:signal recognition particle subunit SEC65
MKPLFKGYSIEIKTTIQRKEGRKVSYKTMATNIRSNEVVAILEYVWFMISK